MPIKAGNDKVRLAKFTLFESRKGFWIIGQTAAESEFRVLELIPDHSRVEPTFDVQELPSKFTKSGIEAWITEQRAAVHSNEGDDFRQRGPSCWGLFGIVRFTSCFYLCMITKCSVVALLGGNKIYHIDETKLVPLVHSSQYEYPDRRSAEARLASTFHSLDLAKTFYFSPTYDLTNTLQTNLSDTIPAAAASMFVWNSHLLAPLESKSTIRTEQDLRKGWFLDVVHGFIDQAKISVFGNSIYITLIARRSHHFAGARFYKRGVNNQGYPANEVETEQIVSNQLHSGFSNRYTSYVQHRGSICVSWSQMSNNMSPKPPIRLDAVDPYYAAAAKHFDRMFARYNYPIRVLNLVKTRERRPRESMLSREFETCIRYLNQFLPQDRSTITDDLSTRSRGLERIDSSDQHPPPAGQGLSLTGGVIEYTHWDMSRAAKSRSSEVMDYLGKYAQMTLEQTSLFQPGVSMQRGVCRTNCIDCLDRTNAAQSVIAKYALGYQLYNLGIIDRPKVDYDTDVIDLLTEMYHDHGDTLALQYGGSNLVNTVETYRRINQWSSHSRDIIESLRRFYSNSFMDAQRQDAINVFLGNYQYTEGTNLWDLSTDYYLHNSTSEERKRSYRQWYEPRHLEPLPAPSDTDNVGLFVDTFGGDDGQLTTLSSLFLAKMNSTDKYTKQLSPFEIHGKKQRRTKELHSEQLDSQDITRSNTPDLLVIDELEILYSKYLSASCTHQSPLFLDAVEQTLEDEYLQYFSSPTDALDTYDFPEAEWSDSPLNEWKSTEYQVELVA